MLSLRALARSASVVQTLKRVPYPSPTSLQNHLDEVAESDPRGRGMKAEQLADTAALEQVEREGFIRQLYGE